MRWLVLLSVLALSRPAAADLPPPLPPIEIHRSLAQRIENVFTGEDGDPNLAGQILIGAYAISIVGCGVVDLSAAAGTTELPRHYGIAETAVHLPIAALWGVGLAYELKSTSDHTNPGLFVAFTAIHAALAAHGIVIAFRDRREPALQVGPVRAVVTPIGITGSF